MGARLLQSLWSERPFALLRGSKCERYRQAMYGIGDAYSSMDVKDGIGDAYSSMDVKDLCNSRGVGERVMAVQVTFV